MAIHTRSSSGSSTTRYLLKDHLGSVDRITDASGNVLVKVSDDSFGKRRDGADWIGPPSSGDWTQIAAATRRGFTGHEHLDNLGLIHMNGRVYDPALGRFIQADPFVPDPLDAQSFNRYSYVRNRPLSVTDPSGFKDDDRPIHTDGGGIGHPMNLQDVMGGHVMSTSDRGGVRSTPAPPRPGVAHGNTVGQSATPGDYVRGCVPSATPNINPGAGAPCSASKGGGYGDYLAFQLRDAFARASGYEWWNTESTFIVCGVACAKSGEPLTANTATNGARLVNTALGLSMIVPGLGAAEGTAAVMARTVSLAKSIEAGLVRPGGKLAQVLGGIERGVAAAQPKTALEAAAVVQRAATQAGLDVGVASVGPAGQIILKNVGGVVTTLGTNGSIVVTRGADVLLGLGL